MLHSIIRSGVYPLAPISLTAMTTRQGSGHEHSPTAIIESQLSEPDEPVLGLYLHVAYHCFMTSFADVGRGEITPNLIGVLALLATRPGMSQAEMARLIGLERATVGIQVARAISSGFVRRRHTRQRAPLRALSHASRQKYVSQVAQAHSTPRAHGGRAPECCGAQAAPDPSEQARIRLVASMMAGAYHLCKGGLLNDAS